MPIHLHRPGRSSETLESCEFDAELISSVPWIDLQEPFPEEIQAIERCLEIELPTREDMREIEASSRFYVEGGARVMTAPVLVQTDTDRPRSTEISFILHRDRLVTIRNEDSRSFRTTAHWLTKRPGCDRDQIFIALLEAIVDRQADLLEKISRETEELSQRIFSRKQRVKESEKNLRDAIYLLGLSGNLISKERDSIIGLIRLAQYAGHEDFNEHGQSRETALFPRLKPVIKDLHSLSEFSGFLTSKVNFMLDATLGLINIEQNSIVKIFSVAAVIFLPPTLVASIYGMNFRFMPELEWKLGYPFAILLMLISVIVPFVFCRRKGWL